MKRKNQTMAMRINAEIREKLEKLAEKDRRTLSDYCRIVLEKHIEES